MSFHSTALAAVAAACLTACSNVSSQDAASPAASDPVVSAEGWTEKTIALDEVNLRVFEMGEGPLVLLVHGWPELAYSWRYQIPAIAAAGYKVVVPDMRGYGASDAPPAISDYSIQKLTGDIVGLVDAYGAEDATIVGHDWGAIVSWYSVLLHPERFNGLAALSVPYSGRAPVAPLTAMRGAFKDNFYYIVYFQDEGVAEGEFDAAPDKILSRLYAAPDTPRADPEVTERKASAGGWIPRLGQPTESPEWMTPEVLEYYVSHFKKSGFRGGINYYRNLDANWETTPELEGAEIDVPVMFLAGEQDVVIRGASAEQLRTSMSPTAKNLVDVNLIPGVGHWVQQEAAEEVNAALIDFINSVER